MSILKCFDWLRALARLVDVHVAARDLGTEKSLPQGQSKNVRERGDAKTALLLREWAGRTGGEGEGRTEPPRRTGAQVASHGWRERIWRRGAVASSAARRGHVLGGAAAPSSSSLDVVDTARAAPKISRSAFAATADSPADGGAVGRRARRTWRRRSAVPKKARKRAVLGRRRAPAAALDLVSGREAGQDGRDLARVERLARGPGPRVLRDGPRDRRRDAHADRDGERVVGPDL